MLDNFLRISINEQYRPIIEQIKFGNLEIINAIDLQALLQNHMFKDFTGNFDFNMRPVTLDIRIVEETPSDYITILPQIADEDIVSGFKGILLNVSMLFNLLSSKFPNVKFGNISTINTNGEIFVEIDTDAYNSQYEEIVSFLNGLDSSIKYIPKLNDGLLERKKIEVKIGNNSFHNNPVLNFISPFLTNSLEFEQRDEAIFFDNIERIYTGEFNKAHLNFYSPKDISCFLDFSFVMANPINIRNYLLWYDKLYITPPCIDIWGDGIYPKNRTLDKVHASLYH